MTFHYLKKLLLAACVLTADMAQAAESEIAIKGIDGALADNVRAFLSLYKESCDTPKWRVQKVFAQADQEIGMALRALGHYHPVVTKTLVFTENCWRADFDIKAGPPVIIRQAKLEVTGAAQNDPAFIKLLAAFPLKPGKTLNHGVYESLKQSLHSLSLERGYINAKFSRKLLRIDPETNSANIELIYASGPRFYFGEVHIRQDILDPDFVRRYINIKPNEHYSSKKLAAIYNGLAASAYFKTLELQPRLANIENLRIPLDIVLYPEKKHSYTLGVGFDTNYGPVFSAGHTNRRINRQGHSLVTTLNVSPVLSTVDSRYIVPLQNPVTDSFSLGLGYKHEEPDTFKSDQFKLSAQRQKISADGWQKILFLDLTHEIYHSSDIDKSSTLLIPGHRWQKTQSNNQIRPTQGYLLSFSVAGAHKAIVSDASFVQAGASAKWITPAPGYGRFITRGDLGATLIDDFKNLPETYRYFAGGTQSIRGYDYKNLGPTDDKNEVIGGKMLTVFSLEYEKFIGEKWGVAAFVDSGNAYNLDQFSLRTGVGVGARWLSPVGPIRIDFAVPLNDSGSSFRIHFAAGAQL